MSPDLECVIGRTIVDKEFRVALLDNPEETIKNEGIILSPQGFQQLKDGIEHVKRDMSSEEIDNTFVVAGGSWV